MPILNYPIRLNDIAMFLNRVFKVDDKYTRILDKEYTEQEWDEFGDAEQDRAWDVLLSYQEIATRAVLGELNALIEYELKWTAISIRRKHFGKSLRAERKLTIKNVHEIIENEFHIKLEDLPNFAEVNEIREVVNAYKHDNGYSRKFEPFFTASKGIKYKLDPDIADKYLSAVRAFLHALPGKRMNLGEDVRVKF